MQKVKMPEWLLVEDDYRPQKGRERFLEKNIITMLCIILKFCRKDKEKSAIINELTKLISAFVLIVFVSLSKSFAFILICIVLVTVLINLLSTNQMRRVLKNDLGIGIFTAIMLLPALFLGYGNNILMIFLKVLFSVSIANMFAVASDLDELVGTFKIFHVPDIFIFIFDIMIKYIILLGNLCLSMLYAIRLRSIGKSRNKNEVAGGILGTVFIKSKESSEEMYSAMKCRGFSGVYKTKSKIDFEIMDYICFILDILFILTYFYFDRL
ncbi:MULTISPECIES: energy-coupling factor transporter transmembrane component T family protein [Clostridium]|uniref:energy-coupling factor transporter transmembrane component T family protein n=1 Tax=Clostridium TaxID=1485 RepID=UPI001FA7732F|nr:MULTISPECIES: energy-coupling factor transporter transmembrane component T [Clostridium]